MSPQQQALAWHSLNATLARQAVSDHVVLDTANELWLQTGFPVRSSYLALLAGDFAAGVKEQDLDGDPAGSARAIDNWVASRTAGHITNLLTPSELQDVVAVMVDAVYMNAPWQTPFDPSLTMPAPFHVAPGSHDARPDDVDFPAAGRAGVRHGRPGRGGTALQGRRPVGARAHAAARATGHVRKPTDPGRARARPSRLCTSNGPISSCRSSSSQTSLRLNQVLSDMGMGQAFSSEADFAPLSPRSLELSFVVHDAQMNVSEKGTEASAATGGGLTPTAMPAPPPVTIVFDHPFLFLVRDNATGTVIFEAQLTDPSSAGG